LLKTVPFFFMTVQLDLDGLSANEIARQSYWGYDGVFQLLNTTQQTLLQANK
jgi:hypothetical protein